MFDSTQNQATATGIAADEPPVRLIPQQRPSVEPALAAVLVADPFGVIGEKLLPVFNDYVDGIVLHLRSVAEIQAAIDRGAPGELAMVSVGFGENTPGVIRMLVDAGWARVLTLTSSPSQEPLLADVIDAGSQGIVRVVCDEHGLQPSDAPLSAREVEVLQLVAEGHSNSMIGCELGLSPLTIKNHLARIGRKLHSGDRARMVAVAFRAGLIS